jgi:hypothetical protein
MAPNGLIRANSGVFVKHKSFRRDYRAAYAAGFQKNGTAGDFFPFHQPILWHTTRFRRACASPESQNPVGRGCCCRDRSIDNRESVSGVGADRFRRKGTASFRPGRGSGKSACGSATRNLGGQPASFQALSLWRRPPFVSRQWLRLFGNRFLCARRGRFDQIAIELDRISPVRRKRPRKMDHDLRAQRPHVRDHCWSSAGHHPVHYRARSMGPGLAKGRASAFRFRSAPPGWFVITPASVRR